VSIVLAVAALDAAPVTRLGALARLVTYFIAVAALHDTRLIAVTGDVVLVAAVVAGTSTSSAAATTTTRDKRLGAVRLVVARCTSVDIFVKEEDHEVGGQLHRSLHYRVVRVKRGHVNPNR
jgi:hypothetical protein